MLCCVARRHERGSERIRFTVRLALWGRFSGSKEKGKTSFLEIILYNSTFNTEILGKKKKGLRKESQTIWIPFSPTTSEVIYRRVVAIQQALRRFHLGLGKEGRG